MDDSSRRARIAKLPHKPWPGLRRAFFVPFAAACPCLAAALFATLPGATGRP